MLYVKDWPYLCIWERIYIIMCPCPHEGDEGCSLICVSWIINLALPEIKFQMRRLWSMAAETAQVPFPLSHTSPQLWNKRRICKRRDSQCFQQLGECSQLGGVCVPTVQGSPSCQSSFQTWKELFNHKKVEKAHWSAQGECAASQKLPCSRQALSHPGNLPPAAGNQN